VGTLSSPPSLFFPVHKEEKIEGMFLCPSSGRFSSFSRTSERGLPPFLCFGRERRPSFSFTSFSHVGSSLSEELLEEIDVGFLSSRLLLTPPDEKLYR